MGCRLHNLAHVELNAIDLAWDTVVRFSELQMDQVGNLCNEATSGSSLMDQRSGFHACLILHMMLQVHSICSAHVSSPHYLLYK